MFMLSMALVVSTPQSRIDLPQCSILDPCGRGSGANRSRLSNADHCHLGFSESASYEDLIASSCTSCQVTQDKSAYWTPALYFQSSSGDFTLVEQVGGMLAYVIPLLLPLILFFLSWSCDQ